MQTLPLGAYTELSKHDLLVRFTPNEPSLDKGLAYDYMLSCLLMEYKHYNQYLKEQYEIIL